MNRTYQTEFPDFTLDVIISPEWEDVSWHNDACPSWNTPGGHKVYVDYADPDAREDGGDAQRFEVSVLGDETRGPALTTNSWQEVLEYVREHEVPVAMTCREALDVAIDQLSEDATSQPLDPRVSRRLMVAADVLRAMRDQRGVPSAEDVDSLPELADIWIYG